MRLCLITMFCIISFAYSLLCVTDAVSAHVIRRNQTTIATQDQQFAVLLQQVEEIQLEVKQRQENYAQLYQRVLAREGRLSEKHLVSPSISRLVGGPHDRSSGVSRSQARYSPYRFDITMPSTVTAFELEQALTGTGLVGLGRAFVQAELAYGINAMFLTALAIHESQWGKSKLALEKNNLFGFGAYDADPYRFAKSFVSKPECIMQVAQFIREQYIDGQLSHGRSLADINRKYASDPDWSQKVFGLMLQIDESLTAAGH